MNRNPTPKNCNLKPKLIIILGPTASGKSALAVKLAKKFNGEIISADSRQVYCGMDIGTGKITKREMRGVPHHLLNVASPKQRFTVTQYRKLAARAINKILKAGKTPILCGGSPFYIRAVIDGLTIPEVSPDWKLRKKLGKKSVKDLYRTLKKLDPKRAETIEKENPRRLIRALEIVIKTKKPVAELKKNPLPYPILMIGIERKRKELKNLIKKRMQKRFGRGMIKEVKNLKKSGLSWERLEEFGLEYRWISRYLQKKIAYVEMVKRLQKDTEHFAKRQATWWKTDARIKWIKSEEEAVKLAKNFLF